MLVRFRDRAAARAHRLRVLGTVRGTGYDVVRIRGPDPRAIVRQLRRDPQVADAQLNYVRHAFASPNDTLYRKTIRQTYLRPLRLASAWDVTMGSPDVKIAILDTGVDPNTTELAGRLSPGWDFVNNDSDTSDGAGHGTEVAAVAAAGINNGL